MKQLFLVSINNYVLYMQVCEELNHPTLTKVQSWPSRMGKWKCIVSEKTGRMFQVYNNYVN